MANLFATHHPPLLEGCWPEVCPELLWSSATSLGSSSQAITFFAFQSHLIIILPPPCPNFSTTSAGLKAALWLILLTMRGFYKMCCQFPCWTQVLWLSLAPGIVLAAPSLHRQRTHKPRKSVWTKAGYSESLHHVGITASTNCPTEGHVGVGAASAS